MVICSVLKKQTCIFCKFLLRLPIHTFSKVFTDFACFQNTRTTHLLARVPNIHFSTFPMGVCLTSLCFFRRSVLSGLFLRIFFVPHTVHIFFQKSVFCFSNPLSTRTLKYDRYFGVAISIRSDFHAKKVYRVIVLETKSKEAHHNASRKWPCSQYLCWGRKLARLRHSNPFD